MQDLKDKTVLILGVDGYLGFPLALTLIAQGCKVVGVDNFSRRRWVNEVGADSAIPLNSLDMRVAAIKDIFGVVMEHHFFDLRDYSWVEFIVKHHKPDVIVHYAENPSAPYSMRGVRAAAEVQANNVLGTLNVLFAMRDHAPDALLLKLGTMGEYGTPVSGRPIYEGDFPSEVLLYVQNSLLSEFFPLEGEMVPRDPGSFYHVSKVQDTYNVRLACKIWGLKAVDIMQGIIYGITIPEMGTYERLYTRFDIDEHFGTVINRFVAQAILGIPLTLYGRGEQKRGFIPLRKAMECMVQMMKADYEPGTYEAVNQYEDVFTLSNLAKAVGTVAEKSGIEISIQNVENPRIELDDHRYNPVCKKLIEKYGVLDMQGQCYRLDNELFDMFRILMSMEERYQSLSKLRHVVLPSTCWVSGKRLV